MINAIARPKRWSYSALSTYEACPAQYAYSYIHKLPSEPSAAMERGTLLHKMCEDYMSKPDMEVPYEVKKIGKVLYDIRNRQGVPEQVWLVDREWNPTDDPGAAWVKGIIDVHWTEGDVLQVRDYKSGREYPSHRDQLELYGILGLIRNPGAKRVETRAIYIDAGFQGQEGSIIRPMLPKLIKVWHDRAERMENDNTFMAIPSGKCGWCAYNAKNGGPCKDAAKAGR